jgi:hypothetical protein
LQSLYTRSIDRSGQGLVMGFDGRYATVVRQLLAGANRVFEPLLEWVPFRLARVACRPLGLSCTIAQRQLK